MRLTQLIDQPLAFHPYSQLLLIFLGFAPSIRLSPLWFPIDSLRPSKDSSEEGMEGLTKVRQIKAHKGDDYGASEAGQIGDGEPG